MIATNTICGPHYFYFTETQKEWIHGRRGDESLDTSFSGMVWLEKQK